MRHDVEARVRAIAAQRLGLDPGRVELHTRVWDLGVDSMALVELAIELEDAFDVALPDERWAELPTLGDVARYCEDRQAVASRGGPV